MNGYIFQFFQCFVSNRSKFCLFSVPKVGFLCLNPAASTLSAIFRSARPVSGYRDSELIDIYDVNG